MTMRGESDLKCVFREFNRVYKILSEKSRLKNRLLR